MLNSGKMGVVLRCMATTNGIVHLRARGMLAKCEERFTGPKNRMPQ